MQPLGNLNFSDSGEMNIAKEDVSPEYFFATIYSISVAIRGIVATDRIVVSATPLEAVS